MQLQKKTKTELKRNNDIRSHLAFDLPKKIIHGSMILLLDRWMDGKLYLFMVLLHVNLMVFKSHMNHNHDIEAYKIIMVINNYHLESYIMCEITNCIE